jgi:hypothetical protein
MSWNIVDNEIGAASNKKFIQTEFKLGNKNISTKQPSKIFNNYIINYVAELIKQQPNTESAVFSLRESFLYEFLQIINIPITETEVMFTISSLKNKPSCGFDGLSSKILNYVAAKFLNLSHFWYLIISSKVCYYKTMF